MSKKAFLSALLTFLIVFGGLPCLVVNLKTVRAESNFNDNFNDGVADGWTQQVDFS